MIGNRLEFDEEEEPTVENQLLSPTVFGGGKKKINSFRNPYTSLKKHVL